MSDFRSLSVSVLASPQITAADIAEAKALGVTLVINNRPDGEEAGQPAGAAIEDASREAGLDYRAIPVTGAGFSEAQVEAMDEALASAKGKVLAFCRSGMRSTLLWSLVRARAGDDPEHIAAAAREAGYDIGPVRPVMEMFAANKQR